MGELSRMGGYTSPTSIQGELHLKAVESREREGVSQQYFNKTVSMKIKHYLDPVNIHKKLGCTTLSIPPTVPPSFLTKQAQTKMKNTNLKNALFYVKQKSKQLLHD
jgi:hypothetical protein